MSSNTIIGWDNLIMAASLAAGSEESNLPASNLQTDIGAASAAWQTQNGVVTAAAGATITIIPTIPGQTWRAFGLFRTNLSASATVTFALYNLPSTLVWSDTVDGPAAGYGQVISVADTDQVADYLVISVDDALNVDGYISVPLAFAGPAWNPRIGPTWQTTFGRDHQTKEVITEGGQEYPIPRWQRRRWEIAFDSIEDSEVWADAQELDRVSRAGGNVLFAPDISSSTLFQEAVFGRVESATDMAFVPGVKGIHSWRFRIKERL